ELADRIRAWVAGDAEVERVVASHAAYISGETLAIELTAGEPPSGAVRAEEDLDGSRTVFGVQRVS
ncbi:MAG: hypothetical protein WHT63_09815, partial [Tepidiforma sp.]